MKQMAWCAQKPGVATSGSARLRYAMASAGFSPATVAMDVTFPAINHVGRPMGPGDGSG